MRFSLLLTYWGSWLEHESVHHSSAQLEASTMVQVDGLIWYGWPEALSQQLLFNIFIYRWEGSTINTHRRYIVFRTKKGKTKIYQQKIQKHERKEGEYNKIFMIELYVSLITCTVINHDWSKGMYMLTHPLCVTFGHIALFLLGKSVRIFSFCI